VSDADRWGDLQSARWQTAATWMRQARRILVFTGAGVSAECGIPTFRDPDGLWARFDPERFATLQGLFEVATSAPNELLEFLIAAAGPIVRAEPNAAHRAIADLERAKSVAVVTQNIDGLHHRAGSSEVHQVHGSLFQLVATDRSFTRSLSIEELWQMLTALESLDPTQVTWQQMADRLRAYFLGPQQQLLRPNVVLFGEMLTEPDWTMALRAAEACDLVLAIGTSGSIFPAASIPDMARACGARVVSVGPEETSGDVWLSGTATEVVPRLVEHAGLAD